MKKILTTITLLLCIVSTNIQAKDVFSGDWVLRLTNDGIKQKVTFKQKGTSVVGKLENGRLLSATWNFKTKRLTGYISIKGPFADPYPFYAFFKGQSKILVVGQYNRYATGKPKYPLNLNKIEEPTKNLKGVWQTNRGKIKFHWDKDNRVKGFHILRNGSVGVINARRKGNIIKGQIDYIGRAKAYHNGDLVHFFQLEIGHKKFVGYKGKIYNNLKKRWTGSLVSN